VRARVLAVILVDEEPRQRIDAPDALLGVFADHHVVTAHAFLDIGAAPNDSVGIGALERGDPIFGFLST
jgi:hypothetical protein